MNDPKKETKSASPACQWRQGGPCTAELEGERRGQECRWRRLGRAGGMDGTDGMGGAAEDPLESGLRRALGPVPMPAGLEEKILAAVHSGGRGKAAGERRARSVRSVRRVAAPAVAAGLLLAALAPGYLHYRSYRHRRTEEARAQLAFALRLTSKKLNLALERANHKTRTGANPPVQEAQGEAT